MLLKLDNTQEIKQKSLKNNILPWSFAFLKGLIKWIYFKSVLYTGLLIGMSGLPPYIKIIKDTAPDISGLALSVIIYAYLIAVFGSLGWLLHKVKPFKIGFKIKKKKKKKIEKVDEIIPSTN